MDYEFGLKELYSLKVKATSNIEIGSRKVEKGEVIAEFDKIEIANFNENKEYISAHGGYKDRGLVYWTTTKDLNLNFTQGIANKAQTSLFVNSKLYEISDSTVSISNREILETDDTGRIELKENPSGKVFVYKLETGEKLDFELNGKEIKVIDKFTQLLVDYEYIYTNKNSLITVGRDLYKGFVSLEGRTKIKEDITGIVRTGIIKIPKVKIVSNLSMRLGKNANPVTDTFTGVAMPVKNEEYVMELFLLEDDIDSDI